jgi:hypothetical protein
VRCAEAILFGEASSTAHELEAAVVTRHVPLPRSPMRQRLECSRLDGRPYEIAPTTRGRRSKFGC